MCHWQRSEGSEANTLNKQYKTSYLKSQPNWQKEHNASPILRVHSHQPT
jgi:hypothetical protein